MNFLLSLKAALISLFGAAAALLGIFLYGRKSGKDAVAAKQAEEAIKDTRKAHAIRDDVRRLSDDDLQRELHDDRKS